METETCTKCGNAIRFDTSLDDWTDSQGTPCNADVTSDSNGDPVFGHHTPAVSR